MLNEDIKEWELFCLLLSVKILFLFKATKFLMLIFLKKNYKSTNLVNL